MKKYLVGGAVRDMISGRLSADRDYVIVGATHENINDMINAGYEQVGNDFPVFLHPVTKDEYALARIERKTGVGYNGFEFETENVTIEQDLSRRDLTINAIAYDEQTKEFIDPFNGTDDIKNKTLRHVTHEAFVEDPVRVLRIARFLARWADYDVAKETVDLCKQMVASGEMNHLTAERVWKETEKALASAVPSRYFVFLQIVGALEIIFPEVHALIGQTQPYQHHPEGDSFVHTMLVMDQFIGQAEPVRVFCALTHDLGKGVTPKHKLPSHHGHEQAGVPIIDAMCDRLKIPNHYRDYAKLIAAYHTHIHNFDKLNAKTIVKMFDDTILKRDEDAAYYLAMVSEADSRGRTSFYQSRKYPNFRKSITVFNALMKVKLSKFKTPDEIKKMSVDEIKKFLYNTKIQTVKNTLKGF